MKNYTNEDACKAERIKTMTEKQQNAILFEIEELGKLLTERIADLHEVPGGMQSRHAYIFYRERLWKIEKMIIEIETEKKASTKHN